MAFQGFLKQSTAVDILLGPFIDETDGKTAETGLTISQADVKLSKNGQTLAQKNDSTAAAHDANGYHNCELDATDTNTVGQLTIICHESGALPVRLDYHIVEESVYNAMYGASAVGPLSAAAVNAEADTALADYDGPTNTEMIARTLATADYFDPAADAVASVTLVATTTTNTDMRGTDGANTTTPLTAAQVNAEVDTALADYDGPTNTEMVAAFTEIKGATWATTDSLEAIRNQGDTAWATATGFSTHSAADVRTEMDNNSTQLAAIVADSNELQTDWANGGRLDVILDIIAADTTTDIPALIATAQSDLDTITGTGGVIVSSLTSAAIIDVWSTDTLAEAYAADGAAGTAAQMLYLIQQMVSEFAISGTTITTKKLDGTTTAATHTMNDDTSPTSRTRAS